MVAKQDIILARIQGPEPSACVVPSQPQKGQRASQGHSDPLAPHRKYHTGSRDQGSPAQWTQRRSEDRMEGHTGLSGLTRATRTTARRWNQSPACR
ncbi:hypothetical protein CRUP_004128 [Coryphaenoides rupestris]|nr:hypothetical protein CRUP_004128 [Coryphaenoides rupestris]